MFHPRLIFFEIADSNRDEERPQIHPSVFKNCSPRGSRPEENQEVLTKVKKNRAGSTVRLAIDAHW
jgi:hypothetical protein